MKTTNPEAPRYRIQNTRSSLNTGSARSFAIEVYEPRPRHFPWRILEGGFGSYAAAQNRLAEIVGPSSSDDSPVRD